MTSDDPPQSTSFDRPELHEEMVAFSGEVMTSLIPRQNLTPSDLLALGALLTWLEEYPDPAVECFFSLQINYHFGDEDYSQTHSFIWSIVYESFDFCESLITSERGVGSESETLIHYAFEAPKSRTVSGSPDFEELLQKIREFLNMGATVEFSQYD